MHSSPSPEHALLAAQHLLAEHLTVHEHSDRAQKMERVLERQRSDLARIDERHTDLRVVVETHAASLSPEDLTAFLVELYFLDPFAPYALKTSAHARVGALKKLAAAIGQDDKLVRDIRKAASKARSAYRQVDWRRVGLIGAGSAAVVGLGGFLAAPALGAAIGGAMGLTGAAAANAGLALLGGGALAAGGAGMAGGMWLVAGAGAAVGAAAGAGGGALFQLGAARARLELVKLQVTFKLTAIDNQVGQIKAQEVMKRLDDELEAMRTIVKEERRLNDENSDRIKQLEQTLDDLESAVAWMHDQASA